MSTSRTTEKRVTCPQCQQKAKPVGRVTLGALLKEDVATAFPATGDSCCGDSGCQSNAKGVWRFCASPGCDVVYFSEDGQSVFNRDALKVPVGVKETTGDRPLCYCFGHSIGSISQELAATGQSTALEDIRAKMKDPGCRCEVENPSGNCCLGSVAHGIKVAQVELGSNPSQSPPASPAKISATTRGQRIARIGTLVSAVMASSCCWLPLLLLAVGVSGAGIASTLEAYRPVFMVVTFGFLGAAFYFTYRPRKAADDCCADSCCPPAAQGRRFTMMSLNKVMLWCVTVLAVAFLLFPQYVGFLANDDGTTVITADMNRAIFQVEGMTCEGCATTLAAAIREVEGVQAVDVNYETGEAVVATAADEPIPETQIRAAAEHAGFTVTPIDAESRKQGWESSDQQSGMTQSTLSVSGMT